MTQQEIISMAREAGFAIESWADGQHVSVCNYGTEIDITNEILRFAALVAAHEREACAKVCEEVGGSIYVSGRSQGADFCAAAIRARGEK